MTTRYCVAYVVAVLATVIILYWEQRHFGWLDRFILNTLDYNNISTRTTRCVNATGWIAMGLLFGMYWWRVVVLGLSSDISGIVECVALPIFAAIATLIMKGIVARPRPGVEPGTADAARIRSGFPSSHSAIAVAAILALMKSGSLALGFFALMICLAVVIGVWKVVSRAHYPSDIIAGWILGGGIVLVYL